MKEKTYKLLKAKERILFRDVFSICGNSTNQFTFQTARHLCKQGRIYYPAGTLFVFLRKNRDKHWVCLPWEEFAVEGVPKGVRVGGDNVFSPCYFELVREATEQELGNASNKEVRNVAILAKLKRLLKEGIVSAKVKKGSRWDTVPEGSTVYIKQGAKFTNRNLLCVFHGKVVRKVSVDCFEYDSIGLVSDAEALTSDLEDLRLQAADMNAYFYTKVEQGIERRYGQAKRGFDQLRRLIHDLSTAKQIIPQDIGRIDKESRKVIAERLMSFAEEIGLQRTFDRFKADLDVFKEKAAAAVQEVLAKSQDNNPT